MKKNLLFWCIFLTAHVSGALQTAPVADSLKQELLLHTAPDSARVLLLVNLANSIYYSQPEEAMNYAREALSLSESNGWQRGKALALQEMGNVYYNASDFFNAMDFFHKALLIAEPLQEKTLIGSLYNNLANISADLEHFDQALAYYQKCLMLARQQQHKKYEMIALSNIGTVYLEQGRLDQANETYSLSLNIAEDLKEERAIAAVLNNIGNIYRKKADYQLALQYLDQSLELARKIGNEYIKSLALNNMGKVNYKLGNLAVSENQALQALAIAKEIGMLEWQADAYKTLSSVYESTSRHMPALQAYKNYMSLTDSILSESKRTDLTRKGLEFEFQKKETLLKARQEKKQALAASEINRQRLLKNSAMAGSLVLLVGGLTSFGFYKSRQRAIKQRQKAEMETLVAELELKALRSQMNPHFIFNSLNSISDYISKHDTKAADTYLTKFAKLMRLTLENSEQKEISLADELKALELYLQLEMLRLNRKFTYAIVIDEAINPDEVMIPPLILQPFVENSIWHGVAPKEGNGKIMLQIRTNADMIECTIEDDGIGRQAAALTHPVTETCKKNSLGMKLTKTRIETIGKIRGNKAEVILADREEGSQVTLKLPLIQK